MNKRWCYVIDMNRVIKGKYWINDQEVLSLTREGNLVIRTSNEQIAVDSSGNLHWTDIKEVQLESK